MKQEKERCFEGTIDLVFRLKKKQYEEKDRAKSMVMIPPSSVEEKLKSLRLKTFSVNENIRRQERFK